MQQNQEPVSILRRVQVQARTGLSRSSIYQNMADGRFPKSVPIGTRAVGWVESEIADWIRAQIKRSRGAA